MNQETNMRSKPPAARWGKLVLALCVLGLLAISAVLSNELVAKGPDIPQVPNPNEGAGVGIAYPTSTHLCVDGCEQHKNWIFFYLPTGSFRWDSLRLKTSLFPAQILTFGISWDICLYEQKAGYTCLVMELSHRLLSTLSELGITPLSELRDTKIWWLEYIREK
jgi:hypothetical protein